MSYKQCGEDGCSNLMTAKGLCLAHYTQSKGPRRPLRPVKQVKPVKCSFGPCNVYARIGGLCNTHYTQKRAGQPLTDQLKKRGSSLVRNEDGLKKCVRCNMWVSEASFNKHERAMDGLASWCTRCVSLAIFGISNADYLNMLDQQCGGCMICGGQSHGDKPLYVDHNRSCCAGNKSCGKCIRGLLCGNCNTAIGMMQDTPARLRAAAEYLERS